MEFSPMTIRLFARFALAGAVLFTAGTVMAQHDMGGGTTSGGATGGSTDSSRGTSVRRTTRRTTPTRRTTAPVRRGVTAEQYNAQGDEFFQADKYDEALEAYQKAVSLKPIATAYYHIGWIQNDNEQYRNALESLRQALSLRANFAEAQKELGYSYYKLSQSQEAIIAYQQAVRMKPDYGSAYLGLGDVYYYQTKQYREAMNAYSRGVQYKDDNPTAFYNLAWSANELGQYDQAANAARKAIGLQADYAEAYAELGFATRKLNQPNEAVTAYRQAIRLKPNYGID